MEKLYIYILLILTGTVYAAFASTFIFVVSIIILIGIFLSDSKVLYDVDLLNTYFILACLLFCVFTLHFLIVPFQNNPLPYIGLFVRIISVGLFYVYIKNKKLNLALLLKSALKVVAYHALISFILSFFVSKYLVSINYNDYYTSTFGYVFFYYSNFNLFGLTLYRNQGIFWEPGILQIYMNILFFISSFVSKDRKLQILTAFLICTTYSTTGIGVLLLQILVILLRTNVSVVKKLLVSLFVLFIMLPLFIINSQQKLNDDADSDVSSSVLRIYDFLEGVEITKTYPLTGIGLSQEAYVAFKKTHSSLTKDYSQEFTNTVSERRSSNSVLYFFTRFGIPFSLCWFFLVYKQNLITEKKWLFFSIVIIENISEPLLIEPFFVLLVASGLFGSLRIRLKDPSPLSLKDVN